MARFEKPRIRRERAQIGQVGPVKHDFLIFRSFYLNVRARLWCIYTFINTLWFPQMRLVKDELISQASLIFRFASKGLVESGKQKDKMLKALQVSLPTESFFFPVNVQIQFQSWNQPEPRNEQRHGKAYLDRVQRTCPGLPTLWDGS